MASRVALGPGAVTAPMLDEREFFLPSAKRKALGLLGEAAWVAREAKRKASARR